MPFSSRGFVSFTPTRKFLRGPGHSQGTRGKTLGVQAPQGEKGSPVPERKDVGFYSLENSCSGAAQVALGRQLGRDLFSPPDITVPQRWATGAQAGGLGCCPAFGEP